SAFTPDAGLDGYRLPLGPESVPGMFPHRMGSAQNGRFALATHAGPSGHAICAISSDPACIQHGGVSVIDVAGINSYLDENNHQRLSAPASAGGFNTSFFSGPPLCAAGFGDVGGGGAGAGGPGPAVFPPA